MTQAVTKLQVGQKLWYVPARLNSREVRDGYEVTVAKVGRKWADVERDGRWSTKRIDIESLYADGRGYSSPGRCYISREHYEVERLTQQAWTKLVRALGHKWSTPSGVTLQDIHEVMRILHLKSEA